MPSWLPPGAELINGFRSTITQVPNERYCRNISRIPRGISNGLVLALQLDGPVQRRSASSKSISSTTTQLSKDLTSRDDQEIATASLETVLAGTMSMTEGHNENQKYKPASERTLSLEHSWMTRPPLPPFMRLSDWKSRIRQEKQRLRKPKESGPLWQRMRKDPFSTNFELNPYAQALAEPVRECAFTNNRLPRSCMLDFHVHDDHDAGQRSLMPLKLAADLIPSHVPHRSTSIQRKHNDEQSSFRPSISAGHLLNHYELMKSVGRRGPPYLGRRFLDRIQKEKLGTLKWRPDMSEFVLAALRKVVQKKIKDQIRRKGRAETIGPFISPPGEGLERLDDIDNVMCVVKLTASKPLSDPNTPIETPAARDSLYGRIDCEDPFGLEGSARDDAADAHRHLRTEKGMDSPSDQSNPTEASTIFPSTSEESNYTPSQGPTRFRRTGHWSEYEENTSLGNPGPLPPPRKPSTLYFPTLRYRNRRVPIYSTHNLLGEKINAELLEGTAFAGKEHMVLRRNPRTVNVQVYLLQLQAYLAREKAHSPKI